jgi:hypothetical protein
MDLSYRDKDLEAEFLVLRKNELQKPVHGNQPGDKKGEGLKTETLDKDRRDRN